MATANYDYVTETNPLNDVGYLNENYSLNGKGWAQVDANEANIAGIYNTPKQKYFFDPSDASFSAGAGDTVGFVTVSQRLDPSAEDSAASTNAGVSASLGDIDLVNGASEALTTITFAIDQVAGNRAEYGALQNRLEYTVSNLMNVSEFTTAARSRIEDADFAAESARLAKAQVLQQSGAAMLAQANASSQLALSLIR